MNPLPEFRLDKTLAEAGDGAVVIGGHGRIVAWNRAAEKILGYSERDVVGRTCCDIFVGFDEDDNRICHSGCRVMAWLRMGETIQNFDMRSRTKSGHPVWLNISVLNVANGQPSDLIVHLFRDVTAKRELSRLVHERRVAPAEHPDPAAASLTRREIEILVLLAKGGRTSDMAERLHVSRATVKNHVQHILAKLGVHSRLEAVAYANRHQLM